MNGIRITNLSKQVNLATNARIAYDLAERERGLLCEETFPAGAGLWICPAQSIHTFGMKFPIDVLFLDPRRRILEICEVPVDSRVENPKAYSVIELPAGVAKRSGSEPGDLIQFQA